MPVAQDLRNSQVTPEAPNKPCASDTSYIPTVQGWLYLAVVLDLFNRVIVGWSIKPRMTADIANDALTMALFRRSARAGRDLP